MKFTKTNTDGTETIKLYHERMDRVNLKALGEVNQKGIIDKTDFSDSISL